MKHKGWKEIFKIEQNTLRGIKMIIIFFGKKHLVNDKKNVWLGYNSVCTAHNGRLESKRWYKEYGGDVQDTRRLVLAATHLSTE